MTGGVRGFAAEGTTLLPAVPRPAAPALRHPAGVLTHAPACACTLYSGAGHDVQHSCAAGDLLQCWGQCAHLGQQQRSLLRTALRRTLGCCSAIVVEAMGKAAQLPASWAPRRADPEAMADAGPSALAVAVLSVC